jgi:hypothetical protein
VFFRSTAEVNDKTIPQFKSAANCAAGNGRSGRRGPERCNLQISTRQFDRSQSWKTCTLTLWTAETASTELPGFAGFLNRRSQEAEIGAFISFSYIFFAILSNTKIGKS